MPPDIFFLKAPSNFIIMFWDGTYIIAALTDQLYPFQSILWNTRISGPKGDLEVAWYQMYDFHL